MPKEKEKVHSVNWSKYLITVLVSFVLLAVGPHILIGIPYWLELPGWEITGDKELPSLILNRLYLIFGGLSLVWLIAKFEATYNRNGRDIKSDQYAFEKIKIPVGGGNSLAGELVKSPGTLKTKAPVLILCHGLGSEKKRMYHFGLSMTYLGFAVLYYDARGHGETQFGQKWDILYIFEDLGRVVDYIEHRARETGDLDSDDIVAIGESMGGGLVLNEGYLEERIKFVIGLCGWADYKFTAEHPRKTIFEKFIKAGYEVQGINLSPSDLQNRLVSPILNSFNKKKGFFDQHVPWDVDNDYRVMIAHTKDDDFVHYKNFEINRDFLKMKPENYIFFEKGNHKFAGGETALIGKILYWFWRRGY